MVIMQVFMYFFHCVFLLNILSKIYQWTHGYHVLLGIVCGSYLSHTTSTSLSLVTAVSFFYIFGPPFDNVSSSYEKLH